MAEGFSDRVEELVFQALDSNDPARALEDLVAANPELEDELRETFAGLEQWNLLDGDEAPASSEAIPERLGRFRLQRRLGAGGMGVVFLAEDEDLRRTVALKVIRPEQLLFPGARERFQREVETIARLQHPGIVPIYSVGRDAQVPYFAMEHVEGCSLAEALDGLRSRGEAPTGRVLLELAGRLGEDRSGSSASGSRTRLEAAAWPDVCVALVLQVASALQHAHERGIFHRDVKPSNILLRPDGTALLVDFGLAWNDAEDQRLTRTQSQLGSLPYMPPEHVDGALTDPSRQADVYGLGVTLYEMLTLRSPFLGPSVGETRRRVLEGRAVPPRRLDRSVSWELETVCLTAMDPDPAKRFRSAAEFGRELERVRDREPILARRPSRLLRARRWAQRHPSLMAAAIVALLALAVSLSVFVWTEREARRRADRLRAASELQRYSALVSTANLELGQGLRVTESRRALYACPEELRGWEWRHLEYLVDESVARIGGLGASVESLTWHPDGGLWLALQDGSLRRVSAGGEPTVVLEGVQVSEVAIDPADGVLVTGTLGGVLQVRDADTGALVQEFAVDQGAEPLGGQIADIEFDLVGPSLFTASGDGRICQWDRTARRLVRDLGRMRGPANCVAVSRDGSAVVAGGYDRRLLHFSSEDFDRVRELPAQGFASGVTFGVRADRLYVASGGPLLSYDLSAPEGETVRVDSITRERGALEVALSPDGRYLAVVLDRRAIHVLRLGPSGVLERLCQLRGHDGLVHNVCFHADGRTFATSGSESVVRIWDPAVAAERALRPHPTLVGCLAQLDGDVVVSGDHRGGLRRTELASNAHSEVPSPHRAPVLAVGPAGGGWVSVDAQGVACRWQGAGQGGPALTWETGETIVAAVVGGGIPPVGVLDVVPDIVAVGERSGVVRLYDAHDGAERATWQAHDAPLSAMVGVGSSFWTGARDGTCRQWDLNGRMLQELEVHPAWIVAIASSDDGQLVATTCADTGVRVFERRSGRRTALLWGHVQAPAAVAWLDGTERLVTSGGFDPELRYWDPARERCIVSVRPIKPVTAMVYDAAERRLFQGNRVGELIWLSGRPGGPLPPAPQDPSGRIDRATSPPGAGLR